MSNIIISVENLSKTYRLGQIGTGSLTNDLKVWWAKTRGKPNPMLKIGQQDHGNRFGETIWALKDMSFEVEQGEVLGIIGRNGAGKSTLLKILSRVTAPTSGVVKVKGRIASLLEVGTGFHPELTGLENIYLNGAILGMSREEVKRKFDEIIEFAGVEQFVDTPVKRYSSGMYVRLAFAVAAHLEPEILLVDEVLAVGDAEFQKKCLGKMGDVAKEGRTVLFVSHNLGSIKSLCERVMLLEKGQIAFDGNAEHVIDTYLKAGTLMSESGIVPDNVPRRGTAEARIRSAHLVDSTSTNISELYLGQLLKLTVSFDVIKEIEDAMLEVSIITLDGTHIIQSFSTDGGKPPFHLDQGRYTANFEMDINLLPRPYSFTLGIYNHSTEKAIDLVEHALDFTILNIIKGDNDYYRWTVRGLIRPTANWSLST
jgi:lipopolysaccharide transport system ATP-binding protein